MMNEEDFRKTSIIALRKTEFYLRAKYRLKGTLLPTLSKDGYEKARASLRKAISLLDDDLFISETERENGRLNPSLEFSQLHLDTGQIEQRLKERLALTS